MKKVIIKILAASVLAVAFAACGGGSGKIPDGKYVHYVESDKYMVFSGNKVTSHNGEYKIEDFTYKIPGETKQINSTTYQKIIITEKEYGKSAADYFTLEGNELCFYSGGCYIKR